MAPCADVQSVNRYYRPHVTAVHLLSLLTKFYFYIDVSLFSLFYDFFLI